MPTFRKRCWGWYWFYTKKIKLYKIHLRELKNTVYKIIDLRFSCYYTQIISQKISRWHTLFRAAIGCNIISWHQKNRKKCDAVLMFMYNHYNVMYWDAKWNVFKKFIISHESLPFIATGIWSIDNVIKSGMGLTSLSLILLHYKDLKQHRFAQFQKVYFVIVSRQYITAARSYDLPWMVACFKRKLHTL